MGRRRLARLAARSVQKEGPQRRQTDGATEAAPDSSALPRDRFLLWLLSSILLLVARWLGPRLESTEERTHVLGTILSVESHGLLSWCPGVPLKHRSGCDLV